MKKFLDLLSNEVGSAFEQAGYEKELGRVTISNRPDLCEYQCNGAMAGAKKYKKAPVMIANEVAEYLKNSESAGHALYHEHQSGLRTEYPGNGGLHPGLTPVRSHHRKNDARLGVGHPAQRVP